VRLVVPFARGGPSDLIARIVADQVAAAFGQPMLVENLPGAGDSVGAAETARAPADGYSLGVATVSTTAANPAINLKRAYDPIADFTPIINITATPYVLAVHRSFPATDFKGFVAELKKNPGKYSFASAGTSTSIHLLMELFKSLTGTFVTYIPYRSSGPAVQDTAAGQVPILLDGLPSTLPFIKSGQLAAIVVAAPGRLAALPSVPTFRGSGARAHEPHGLLRPLRPEGTVARGGRQGERGGEEDARGPGRQKAHRGHRRVRRRQYA
jgi:tripartite-type tricarboxylate transporter receptor subunit TctC